MKKQIYFSHDSNARNDEKILAVRMRHKAEGYAIYFMLIERLREDVGYVSIKDYNVLAFDFRVETSLVKSIVEDFGLFEFTEDGKGFYSKRLIESMKIKNAKSEVLRENAHKRWHKSNSNAIASPPECKSKASKVKESKVKLSKKDIDKSISQKGSFQKPTIEEVKAFFRLKIGEKRKEKSCAKKENPGGSNGVSLSLLAGLPDEGGNAEREKIWRLTERFDVEMEAEKFISFYDSQGWKVGKNPMKRWRGSASGWFLRSLGRFEERDRRQPKLQQQSKGLASDLVESNRMAKEMLAKQMENEPD